MSKNVKSRLLLSLHVYKYFFLQFRPEPPKPKRLRMDEPNNRTPITSLRINRSLLTVAIEEERAGWESEKQYLQQELVSALSCKIGE